MRTYLVLSKIGNYVSGIEAEDISEACRLVTKRFGKHRVGSVITAKKLCAISQKVANDKALWNRENP